jgi:hypothetical protein
MTGDLDPRDVAARLSDLRSRYVAESVSDARARLAREQPRPQEPFEQVAARSLAELRALCELARVLHRARADTQPT